MGGVAHLAKFGRSRSNGTSVITEIRRRDLTPRVPPFKVTEAHQNQHESIGYLCLINIIIIIIEPISDT